MSENHLSCSSCGHNKCFSRYPDGSEHCFSCGHHESANKSKEFSVKESKDFATMTNGFQILGLPQRRISQATCEAYDYYTGNSNGKICQAALNRNSEGRVVSRKLRFSGKVFVMEGDTTDITLWGQHKFKPNPKINVVVTEGELDALSIADIQECKWPVVSLPLGAQHAKSAFKKNLAWLKGWKSVILAFDDDEQGRKAEESCAMLFEAGKVKLLRLPLKDANDMLKAGRIAELQKAVMNPVDYKPDSLILQSEITYDMMFKDRPKGLDIPYPMLNELIRGLHKKKLVVLTSGWGMGKSTFMHEIGYALAKNHGLRIGNIFLEDEHEDTLASYLAIDREIFLGELTGNPEKAKAAYADAMIDGAWAKLDMVYHDHKGMIDPEEIFARIDYMASGLDCDFILFDHLTHMVSGTQTDDERMTLDRFLIRLKSIALRTGCGIITACQLTQSGSNKSINLGGEAALNKLRGSGQMAAVPDVVIALEGNQQDEENGNLRRFRILKNRTGQRLGTADTVEYDYEKGRLMPTAKSFKEPQKSREVIGF